jgi:hypothetical protein
MTSVLLNNNNIKGVSARGVNIKEASVISVNIVNKSSSGNRFKSFFFLIKELIYLYSF